MGSEPVPAPAPGEEPLPDDIQWMSTTEAARRLGVTPRTLYRLMDSGQVPGYRVGRVIRLQRQDVDAFIRQCRIQPGTLEHLYPETSSSTTDETET